jgi:hypothetical protein
MKEILLNRVPPFLLLLHWVLAFFYFPLWRAVTVPIHPFNEDWQTQVLMLLDLPAIAVAGEIGVAFNLESSIAQYIVGFVLISLQWILVGYFIKAIMIVLSPKN